MVPLSAVATLLSFSIALIAQAVNRQAAHVVTGDATSHGVDRQIGETAINSGRDQINQVRPDHIEIQ
jgi:hypothetical protein